MEKPINQFYASVAANVLTGLASGGESLSDTVVDGIRDRWLRNYQLLTHDELDLEYSERERTEDPHVEVNSNVLFVFSYHLDLCV